MDQEKKASAVDARDVLAVIGVAMITGGTALMHIPSALIVFGMFALGAAIMAARR